MTYIIFGVSNLIFSYPESNHRKTGSQNLLKGKILRKALHGRSLFLLLFLLPVDIISYVLQYIFFNGDTMDKFFNSSVLGSMRLQQW